jgi:hypothetical protein
MSGMRRPQMALQENLRGGVMFKNLNSVLEMKVTVAQALAGGLAILFTAGPAIAGKVNIPKEGSFEFQFCQVGEEQTLSAPDKVSVGHYRIVASTFTVPAGRAFDRMSGLCYGTYAMLNGRYQEFGVCEMTDVDGDKWWMEYHGNPAGGGGTHTSAHGTGKYEGMTFKGQYAEDSWPSAAKGVFQGCNPNKGTYKLK